MKNKTIIITALAVFMGITTIKSQQNKAIKQQHNMKNTDLAALRKSKVITYFKKVDGGQFDEEYFSLYTDDVELYYPKFGFEKGKDGIRNFGKTIGGHLQSLTHDIDGFNYIISDNTIVVEGTEKGITRSGKKWPDNRISLGKFCNVFEFEGEFIKRVHIYVDPDFTSEDADRVKIFNNPFRDTQKRTAPSTKEVLEELYAIQSGKRKGIF